MASDRPSEGHRNGPLGTRLGTRGSCGTSTLISTSAWPRERPCLQGRFRWRDPDSNRGHHDFQYSARKSLTRRNPCADAGSRASDRRRLIGAICELFSRVWVPGPLRVPNATAVAARRAGGSLPRSRSSGRQRSPRRAASCGLATRPERSPRLKETCSWPIAGSLGRWPRDQLQGGCVGQIARSLSEFRPLRAPTEHRMRLPLPGDCESGGPWGNPARVVSTPMLCLCLRPDGSARRVDALVHCRSPRRARAPGSCLGCRSASVEGVHLTPLARSIRAYGVEVSAGHRRLRAYDWPAKPLPLQSARPAPRRIE